MVNLNKKQNDILVTAKELFWKHGFKRVSIEEICQKANVSKMTFYKNYPNKKEVAKAVIDWIYQDGEDKIREIFNEDSPAGEKIGKLLLLKAESTLDISTEFLQDFYTDREPELKAYIEVRTGESWNRLIEDFKVAQQNGLFRKNIKIEFLIKVQAKIAEMIQDESLLNMYSSKQELVLEFSNLFLYGIVPRD